MNGLEGRFPGLRRPASDFKAVRSELQTGVLMFELDLSSARSIAAGTAAVLKLAGNSIYVDKNPDVGAATVIFQDDSNLRPARVFVQPGFIARVPWTLLTIENVAQTGKVLRFFYGVDIDFQPGTSNEITLLQTSASGAQGADLIVSNGNAFSCQVNPGAVAGSFCYAQLFNPVGSGKTLYIDGFHASSSQTTYYGMRRSNAALASLASQGENNLFGGAAHSAQVRFEANAGILGVGNYFEFYRVINGSLFFYKYPNPYRVPEGQGMLARNLTVNQELIIGWHWREY